MTMIHTPWLADFVYYSFFCLVFISIFLTIIITFFIKNEKTKDSLSKINNAISLYIALVFMITLGYCFNEFFGFFS